jgi:Raf kinase inhibitor-like YbhB/YbcL family protein
MELTSTSITEGEPIDLSYAHASVGGRNVIPQLSWTPGPAGTKSYAITIYDPDAPTGSGFWHWILADVPADVTEIPEGGPLPAGVRQWVNDAQEPGYSGPFPPAGPAHRYIHTVHAMPSAHLDAADDAANVQVRFAIHTTELDQASVTGTFQVD